MLGITLVALGALFAQIGTSIGKYEVTNKRESLYAMGFLHALSATIFLIIIAIFWRGEFVFSLASIPTFAARAVLEIIALFVGLNAIAQADRSTFSFLKVLAIPLLLVVDTVLGYEISLSQMIGISIVAVSLLLLLINHGLSRRGKILSTLAALLAVGTLSLYKYNITHYNSVEAEQIVMLIILMGTIIIVAQIHLRENVFKTLTHKLFIFQSVASGIGTVFISFAFLFAPASIITTAKYSLEILTSMIFGRTYFYEKHFLIKSLALVLIIVGMALMFV